MPNIILLSGDGIGPEIMAEAERVLDRVNEQHALGITTERCLDWWCRNRFDQRTASKRNPHKSQQRRGCPFGRRGRTEMG